ncbi:MAG: right-handed parallel beta-helix repeat-containing protein, partial [Deltaproteobacteria bacterium]|nr:right-handed parallel beta-helix repeat-containing protein [Deltaproteobacteria bacterium]
MPRYPLALPFLLAIASAGCGSEETTEPAPPDPEPEECGPGALDLPEGCKPAGIPTCAEGFVSDELGGCLPVLPPAPCPEGTMAVPGETVCREVAPCGDGTWGDIPVAPDTQHVDGAYAGGDGDGTAVRPWPTIAQGIAAAAPGAIVAVAAGSYLEDLTVQGKPVVLWGRCPALVELRGGPSALAPLFVRAGANGTAVRDLALTGPQNGLACSGSLDVLADRVWIHHTGSRGLSMESTLGPTSVTLARSLVEQTTGIGAFTLTAPLTIEDSVVRQTQPTSERSGGIGVQTGATLELRTSVVEFNGEDGIFVSSSEALVESSVVRDTQPDTAQAWGGGISILRDNATQEPSSATLRDTLVERNRTYGIFVEGSTAALERVVVRDTQAETATDTLGPGIQVQNHAALAQPSDVTIREAVFERNHYAGISVTGATAWIESVIVRDTVRAPARVDHGRGILVFFDAASQLPTTATVLGSVVERNTEAGIFGQAVELTVDRTAVRDTNPRTDDSYAGRGISMQSEDHLHPSHLIVRDSLLENNHNSSLLVGGTFATIERTEV